MAIPLHMRITDTKESIIINSVGFPSSGVNLKKGESVMVAGENMPPIPMWLNEAQKDWLKAMLPAYRRHRAEGSLSLFWPAVEADWFLTWDSDLDRDSGVASLAQERQKATWATLAAKKAYRILHRCDAG